MSAAEQEQAIPVQTISPHKDYPRLLERLQAALRFDGVVSPDDQERHLAKAAGVHIRTARSWLQGRRKPRPGIFNRLCEGLDVDFAWLGGREFQLGPEKPDRHALIAGMPEWKIKLIHGWLKMTAWEKNKFHRYVMRLANNDAKAFRLAEMRKRGQISRRQLFEAM
jgi:transcriptional regulator with XRE-family HTH domain